MLNRLPGLSFDIVPAPTTPGLPNMDIAIFAGFAARGPCHRAITIDSPAAFAATFGGDLPLAHDDASGMVLTANLAPAVRAFFANGGRRAQVIRLARTAALAELWEAGAQDDNRVETAQFPISGALVRRADGVTAPARLTASSPGSWGDTLTLAARLERRPVVIESPQPLAFGLRFANLSGVQPGDLIEITDADGSITRYARAIRAEGPDLLAAWSTAFESLGPSTLPLTGGGGSPLASGWGWPALNTPVTLTTATTEIPTTLTAIPLRPGNWLTLTAAPDTIWLRADTIDGARVTGPAWRQLAPALPTGAFTAQRLTLAILSRQPSTATATPNLGTGLLDPDSLALLPDDEAFYAASDPIARPRPSFAAHPDDRAALTAALAEAGGITALAARFATPSGTAADAALLTAGWLPLGLGSSYPPGDAPIPAVRPALARDGLSRLDHQLFLDPDLAGLGAAAVIPHANALREQRPLFGIHAALDTDADPHDAASITAIPDAAQPGWQRRGPPGPIAPPDPGSTVPPRWRDHAAGCAAGGSAALAAPDTSRFLDCDTQVISTPVLTAPTLITTPTLTLAWSTGAPGTVFVLETAPRADFAATAELYRGPETRITLPITEGLHYFRLHAELAPNISAFAAAAITVQRSQFAATAADPDHLARLHTALLRLAAGSANSFALLSLPQGWRAETAAAYARDLASVAPGFGGDRLGHDEIRALSHGAVHHPWLVAADGTGTAPDGAIAGTLAARARKDGAWAAPANRALADVIGLDPSPGPADFGTLDAARINSIRRTPRGFMALAAHTLSPEPDWRHIATRRLMILLRRVIARTGAVHVFEPDTGVTRRAIERSLTQLLDSLQRRGAFAGATSAQSFRVAATTSDADARLVTEIAVAPASPLRFLTIRLARRGAVLSVTEAD